MTVAMGDIIKDPWAQLDTCAELVLDDETGWERVRRALEVKLGDDHGAWVAAVEVAAEQLEVDRGDEPMMERGDNATLARWIHRRLNRDGAPCVNDLGAIWAYRGGVWVEYDEDLLTVEIINSSGTPIYNGVDATGERREPKKLQVNSTAQTIKMLRALPSSWGGGKGYFDDAPRGIAFEGVFLEARPREGLVRRHELGAHHKARTKFPFEWDPNARAPKFEKYLEDIWGGLPDYAERVAMLGEFAGAALFGMGATRYHKALILKGEPGSGKSTFLRVLESIFPPGTVAHVSPTKWENDDQLGMLLNVRLNTVYEASKGVLTAQDTLKSVLGGEGQTVVRKWERAATFYPEAAHAFAVNTWPPVPGADRSFWDRWIVLTMDRRFRDTDDEVRDLANQIAKEEQPGLAAWAVAGARRLLEQDAYTIPPSSLVALEDWQENADSLNMWLAEEVEDVNGEARTKASEAYSAFKKWAVEGGFKTMNRRTFGMRLAERGIEKHKVSSYFYAFKLKSQGPI